jgi:hypothetical protein
VPLRRDSRSDRWGFWHVQTSVRPEPNPDAAALASLILTGDNGLVFILTPGGTFHTRPASRTRLLKHETRTIRSAFIRLNHSICFVFSPPPQ